MQAHESRMIRGDEVVEFCPACGDDRPELEFTEDIFKCSGCNLLYRSPRPDQETIFQAYAKEETFASWQDELNVREMLWRKRLKLVRRHVSAGRLLDIGTGDGYFLTFANRFFRAMGTEISPVGKRLASRFGVDVYQGSFRDSEFRHPPFDLVTLWHVLEHVPDPAKTLEDLKNWIKPGGLLVLAVPNEALKAARYRWLGRFQQDHFEPILDGEEIHLTFFVPATLKKLVEAKGFEILEFGVDDVAINRTLKARLGLKLFQLMNQLFGTHAGPAMYLVCRSSNDGSKNAIHNMV